MVWLITSNERSILMHWFSKLSGRYAGLTVSTFSRSNADEPS